jgi:hypothetical protein
MATNGGVRVPFDDFVFAVSQLARMKRVPRGSTGNIPTDTLLSAHENGIMVETSIVSSLVNADRPWALNLSVDAKKLTEVCETLRKLGAVGQTIHVAVDGGKLNLKFRTTTISIPTLWVNPA